MSESREQVDRVRTVYDSFARQEVGPFIELVHPDVIWVEPEGVEHAGTYRGRDAVLRDVLPRNTEWEEHRVVPEEMLGDGRTVVVIGHYTGRHRRTRRDLRASFVHLWRFGPTGTVTRFEAVIDTGPITRATGKVG